MTKPISEGTRYTIRDTLDASVAMTFDSWSHPDPAARAFEAFDAYPRQAQLYAEPVVKYERELLAEKGYPSDQGDPEPGGSR